MSSNSSISSPTLGIVLLILVIRVGAQRYLKVVLTCVPLMTDNGQSQIRLVGWMVMLFSTYIVSIFAAMATLLCGPTEQVITEREGVVVL